MGNISPQYTGLENKLVKLAFRKIIRKQNIRYCLEASVAKGHPICIFGGALRDLMTIDKLPRIRDFDLVVEGQGESLHGFLSRTWKVETNSFGGCRFKHTENHFDVWQLNDTWAFRNDQKLKKTFANLPKTTFLNIEAIALVYHTLSDRPKVYEHGFFEAIENRLIEINYEKNPNPLGCVTRALVNMVRLKFGLGPKLLKYIQLHRFPATEYLQFQRNHYGAVILETSNLLYVLDKIDLHLAKNDDKPCRHLLGAEPQVRLLSQTTNQLQFIL